MQKVKDIITGGHKDDASTHNTRSTASHGTHAGEGLGGSHVSATPQQEAHLANTDRFARPGGESTHDHQHLAAVTKEERHQHEVEEVTRTREHDRHVHHVASHVQPVKDTQHSETVHHQKTVPVTEIREQHSSTAEDKRAFAGLHSQHKDQVVQGSRDKVIVDKGEVVDENLHHHVRSALRPPASLLSANWSQAQVHHVVQPVIERDVHETSVQHTTIPTKVTTHEAPILHQSTVHEPMAMKDFVKGGGDLSSKTTHDKAGVLADGSCDRQVRGPGEKLAEKLHLGGTHSSAASSGSTAGTTGGSGMMGGQERGMGGSGVGMGENPQLRRE